jgi:endonuclease/exonuclease/phosphatase family metal-dependent hydrolase
MTQDKLPKRKSRTNWLVLGCNFVVIVALLLSYLSAHVAPSTIGYLALFGLAFPFIILFNFCFIVYWFFKKRKFALFSVFAILCGINHCTHFFQLSLGSDLKKAENKLKILSYNVRLFDLYNAKDKKINRNNIFDLLEREQADIICFQEFYFTERKGFFETRDTLIKFLPNKYYHERYTHAVNGKQYFGVALFSKYPIVSKGSVPFASDANNFCIYADIKVGNDTIRVYDAHLQSIRFRPEDYALVDGNRNQEELDDGSIRIAKRLKKAFVKREEQVNRVCADVTKCKFPVIVCGDFNDTPVSYTYSSFDNILEDSFTQAGNGIGNTYIGSFPSFRIDYIFHSKTLQAATYETLSEEYSDHHAITSTLIWKD